MKIRIWLLLTALLLAVVVLANARLSGRSPNTARTTRETPAIYSDTTPQASDRAADEAPLGIQVVLITLRPEGFEPVEMQIAPGEYLFVVRNRTGLDEVSTQLMRENGEHLGQANIGARRRDWKQRLKLTPGTYLLSEADHPDVTCRIVVTH